MEKEEKQELNESNNLLPWIEKYRPKNLDEILSHNEIVSSIKIFIKNRCLPHLLLYGQPGTGKSSLIMSCARELYGKYVNFMVMELNASDDRGIEVVRTKIKQFVMSDNVYFGDVKARKNIFKLVILDEADSMTNDAQAILRKIIEKYTYNTRFCLICNYIQNISLALQSRCTKFRFSPISDYAITTKIKELSVIEKFKITNDGVKTIIKRSNGDMRKVLNILQATSMAYKTVNLNNINLLLGFPTNEHINQILKMVLEYDFNKSYNEIQKLIISNGLSMSDIMAEMHDIFVDYIINNNKDNRLIEKITLENLIILLDGLRIIEFNQSINTNSNIQIAAFISIFKLLKK